MSAGSSINPHYTFAYAQPPEYRFSHDSVFLARRAFEALGHRLRDGFRLLDLAAGCGIVGLDFMSHLKAELGIEPAVADFVEVQPEYREAFEENVRRLGPARAHARFVNTNWTDVTAEPYDVVLCNPPYFRTDEGRLPKSDFRARCHFFRDADWASLVACVTRNLASIGDAFVLCRDPRRNRFDGARLDGAVRGTPLYHVAGTATRPSAQN